MSTVREIHRLVQRGVDRRLGHRGCRSRAARPRRFFGPALAAAVRAGDVDEAIVDAQGEDDLWIGRTSADLALTITLDAERAS